MYTADPRLDRRSGDRLRRPPCFANQPLTRGRVGRQRSRRHGSRDDDDGQYDGHDERRTGRRAHPSKPDVGGESAAGPGAVASAHHGACHGGRRPFRSRHVSFRPAPTRYDAVPITDRLPPHDVIRSFNGSPACKDSAPTTPPRFVQRVAISRRSASRYFSAVCRITASGNRGPGAVLSQSRVSR